MSDNLFEDDDKRHKKQRQSRELQLLTIRNIMKTENGRSFMWRSLQNCCTFDNIFSDDAIKHSYMAGARSHGLWLESELKDAAPDEYIMMRKEHLDE